MRDTYQDEISKLQGLLQEAKEKAKRKQGELRAQFQEAATLHDEEILQVRGYFEQRTHELEGLLEAKSALANEL